MRGASEFLFLFGAAWCILAAVGTLRLRDSLARVHAATKATTLGLALVLIGASLSSPLDVAVKLLLAMALVVLTAPVGGHLMGRAVDRNPGEAEVDLVIDTRDE